MTSQADFVSPSRIANWLLKLFTPEEEAESITGDLLEEFSSLASSAGVTAARCWYWRQTRRSVAHLFLAGFRGAPVLTVAAVAGGFVLGRLVYPLPDKLLSLVTDRYLFYWSAHFKTYMFWATDGMLMAHFIVSLFVGCVVALAAKGREMVATLMLSAVLAAMFGIAFLWSIAHSLPLADTVGLIVSQCTRLLAIVAGGGIVRTFRSAPRLILKSGSRT
jgi:hypothetical protein